MAAPIVVVVRLLLYLSAYGLLWGTSYARWVRHWDLGGWWHVGGTLAFLVVAGVAQTRRAPVVHALAAIAAVVALVVAYPAEAPMTFSRQVSRVAIPILPWAVVASALLSGGARLREGARARLRAWSGLGR